MHQDGVTRFGPLRLSLSQSLFCVKISNKQTDQIPTWSVSARANANFLYGGVFKVSLLAICF